MHSILEEKYKVFLKTSSKPKDLNIKNLSTKKGEDMHTINLLGEEEHHLLMFNMSEEVKLDFENKRIFIKSRFKPRGNATNFENKTSLSVPTEQQRNKSEGNNKSKGMKFEDKNYDRKSNDRKSNDRKSYEGKGSEGKSYDSKSYDNYENYDDKLDNRIKQENKVKTINYNWYVKSFDIDGYCFIDGPYINKELKYLFYQGKLDNTLIKREFDNIYIPFEDLLSDVNNFIYSPEINNYFKLREEQFNIDRNLKNEDDDDNNNTNDGVDGGFDNDDDDEIFDASVNSDQNKIEGSFNKTKNFIIKYKIEDSVEEIIDNIFNRTYNEAKNSILKMRYRYILNDFDIKSLLDLIILETKEQILSDVDKDGFTSSVVKSYPNNSNFGTWNNSRK